jgi:hypothetical protein
MALSIYNRNNEPKSSMIITVFNNQMENDHV